MIQITLIPNFQNRKRTATNLISIQNLFVTQHSPTHATAEHNAAQYRCGVINLSVEYVHNTNIKFCANFFLIRFSFLLRK